MKKSTIMILAILAHHSIGIAQEQVISFPSPEAANLGTVNLFPVDYHTGGVNVEIPLFNVSVNEYNIPITLQYKTTGFQPTIRPTWVGQNWTLNVGGVITRSVKDKPDETEGLGFSDIETYKRMQSDNWNSDQTMIKVINSKCGMAPMHNPCDNEPDDFYFSINGISGKFCLDNYGKIRALSHPDIKVEYENSLFSFNTNNASIKTFKGFKMTLNDGTICCFGYDTGLIETTYSKSYTLNQPPVINATSWYLKYIELPQSGRSIDYKYSKNIHKKQIQYGCFHCCF